MPSPFPGMDPYLEGWEWEPFHAWFVGDIGDALSPLVRPRYMARPQRRVYVEHPDDPDEVFIADAAVHEPLRHVQPSEQHAVASTSTATLPPVEVVLAMPEERVETYLTIRDALTRKVITVIELLSPANKRPGSSRRKYLKKRESILRSRTNLVEIDLLRGGRRVPVRTPLPHGDYLAIVSRAGRRPRAEVYAWTVRHKIPGIPIPLRDEDPDVRLELQSVFGSRYERAGYRHTLDYGAKLRPPLSDADARWAEELLNAFRG